jgi:xanthine dehydrogenase YagS FAD-binding subunit
MTVVLPRTLEEALTHDGEYRAGGTDVEARRRSGLAHEVTIDLRQVPGMTGIDRSAEGTRIGAMTRVTSLAHELRDYPAIAQTAASLANPHTRAVGTVGGNLLQQTRCWYFRTGDVDCFKTGGEGCPARAGIHHFGNVFDTSSCVAPHPSSLAAAFLLYDAVAATHPGGNRRVADLYDEIDPTAEHALGRDVLTSIALPVATEGERGAYWRATARSLAEWPLVEAVCRLVVADGRIQLARVAAGGVAPVPVRLLAVEEALEGTAAEQVSLAAASSAAGEGARPAPQAAYKVRLLEGTVLEVLERALAGDGATEAAGHERPL